MKLIIKSLTSYITNECGQTLPKGLGIGDLRLIAMDGNVAETVKAGFVGRDASKSFANCTSQLLRLVLTAAIHSPKAAQYIEKMPTLTTPTQEALKDILEEIVGHTGVSQDSSANPTQFQNTSNTNSDIETSRDDLGTMAVCMPAQDQELLAEETFGKLMAENERFSRDNKDLQKDLRDLHNRLTRLQENNASPRHFSIGSTILIFTRKYCKKD